MILKPSEIRIGACYCTRNLYCGKLCSEQRQILLKMFKYFKKNTKSKQFFAARDPTVML